MESREAVEKLEEAAQRATGHRELAPVSFPLAILAVLVATVALLGHRSHTEEILLQTQATDQWGYYRAKNMRRNNLEALDDVLTALENTKAERAQEVPSGFTKRLRNIVISRRRSRTKLADWRGKCCVPAVAPIGLTSARCFWKLPW
jgi:hypothetical protein